MIKAIVFDVDGMLNNGKRFSDTLEEDFGLSATDTSPFFKGKFQECLVGKADLKEEVKNHLQSWGWEKSVDDFLHYWFTTQHQINEPLINEVELLQKKGIKCYVATNNEKYRTAYIIDHMGFGKIFDGIFSSAHVGSLKPKKDFYDLIIQKIGHSPKEISFWDDDEKNVAGARTAGLNADLYTDLIDFKKKIQRYLST